MGPTGLKSSCRRLWVFLERTSGDGIHKSCLRNETVKHITYERPSLFVGGEGLSKPALAKALFTLLLILIATSSGLPMTVSAGHEEPTVVLGNLEVWPRSATADWDRNFNVTIENTAAAESRIRDVDFASETAELTRNQVLSQAGISILSQANLSTQNALSLLN